MRFWFKEYQIYIFKAHKNAQFSTVIEIVNLWTGETKTVTF